jgi:hypothetical protein
MLFAPDNGHQLAVHKEAWMRFREPARKLVVFFNQAVHNHLDRFQLLEHDRAMLFRIRWRQRNGMPGIGGDIGIGQLLSMAVFDLSATG